MSPDLVTALDEARAAFLEALASVDADLVTVPGIVEDWSVRDLVVHVAFWADHASSAIDLALDGRGDEFTYSTGDTDAMNARLLADSQSVSPDQALDREETAFTDLRERVAALGPSQLSLRLGNGDTVEQVIRYDGPDHYAEHTAHLRSWFGDEAEDPQD